MAGAADDLAAVFGDPGGIGPPGDAGLESEPDIEAADEDEEFRSAMADAFPELADSPERMTAIKQAVEACVRQFMRGGGYG